MFDKVLSYRFQLIGQQLSTVIILSGLALAKIFPPGFQKLEAVIEPNAVIILEGETLELNCTITSEYNGTLNFSSVYFMQKNCEYGPQHVHIKSNRSASLVLKNVTKQLIASCGNQFQCAWNRLTPELHVASAKVSVFRSPQSPVVSRCRILNWRRIECSWGPSIDEQLNHTYATNRLKISQDFRWQFTSDSSDLSSWTVLQGLRTGSYAWSLDYSVSNRWTLCVQVKALLIASPQQTFISRSNITCFNISQIAQPNAPTNLTHISYDRWHVLVVQLPYSNIGTLLYWIEIDSQWDQKVTKVITADSQSTSNVIIPLEVVPFTNYTIRIKYRLIESTLWSDSAVYHFVQPSSSPCSQPLVASNAFSVLEHFTDRRLVRLYWKNVNEVNYCGPGFRYQLNCKRLKFENDANELAYRKLPDICDIVFTKDSSIELLLDNKQYVISVRAINDFTKELVRFELLQDRIIKIPARDFITNTMSKSTLQEIIAEGNGTSVTLTWIGNLNDATGITLFWCKRQHSEPTCKGPIDWINIDKWSDAWNQQNVTITLSANFYLYFFGYAVNRMEISSGINWSQCTYHVNALAEPPIYMQATAVNHDTILVSWSASDCKLHSSGYAITYVIAFCPCDVKRECIDIAENITVDGHPGILPHYYNLTGLKPNSSYRLWLYSRSKAGLSEKWSEVVFANTSDKWDTVGVIIGITISSLTVFVITVIGLLSVIQYSRKWIMKSFFRQIRPTIPQEDIVCREFLRTPSYACIDKMCLSLPLINTVSNSTMQGDAVSNSTIQDDESTCSSLLPPRFSTLNCATQPNITIDTRTENDEIILSTSGTPSEPDASIDDESCGQTDNISNNSAEKGDYCLTKEDIHFATWISGSEERENENPSIDDYSSAIQMDDGPLQVHVIDSVIESPDCSDQNTVKQNVHGAFNIKPPI